MMTTRGTYVGSLAFNVCVLYKRVPLRDLAADHCAEVLGRRAPALGALLEELCPDLGLRRGGCNRLVHGPHHLVGDFRRGEHGIPGIDLEIRESARLGYGRN